MNESDAAVHEEPKVSSLHPSGFESIGANTPMVQGFAELDPEHVGEKLCSGVDPIQDHLSIQGRHRMSRSRTSTNMPTLLLVEDDPVLRQEFGEYLSGDGFAVHSVATVMEAERALTEPFDLMVLDLNLPDGSGIELCQRLRPYLRSGIVICSGRSERELRVSLLRSGADAFMVKPVDAEELSATLSSVLRRVIAPVASPMRASQLPSLWRLDRVHRCLWAPKGKQVMLSAHELLLLQILLEQPEQLVGRQQILARFEEASMPITGSRLETIISRLRAKVFDACGAQLPLRASYGRGYIFAAHADAS